MFQVYLVFLATGSGTYQQHDQQHELITCLFRLSGMLKSLELVFTSTLLFGGGAM